MKTSKSNNGWNRPKDGGNGKSRKRGSSVAPSVCAICVGVLVLLFVAVWYVVRNDPARTSRDLQHHDKTIKETAPKSTKRGASVVKLASTSPNAQQPIQTAESASAEPVVEQAQTDTNTTDKTTKQKRKVVFTNPMDQLLAMVAPKEAGDAVPPVPISDDMEFTPEQEKQMFERLVAQDDDSEEVLERKELVQALRNEYVELKKERGWKFVDYIKALEAKAKLDNELLTESWKIHETVFNDPHISDEKYYETLKTINRVLGDRGIKPISMEDADEEQR